MQPTDSLLPWLPFGYFFNVHQPNQNPQQQINPMFNNLQAHRQTHPSHNQRRPPQQRPAHRRPAPPTSDQIAQFERLQLHFQQAQALQHQDAQAPPPNHLLTAYYQQRPRNLPAQAPQNNVALGANFGAPNFFQNPHAQLAAPQFPQHIQQQPTIPAHHQQIGALLMTSQFFDSIQWYCDGGPLETLPPLDNANTAQNPGSTNAALPAPAPRSSNSPQAPPPPVPVIQKPVPIPPVHVSVAPPQPSSPTPPPETPEADSGTPPPPVPVIHKPVPIHGSVARSHPSMGIQNQPGKLQGPGKRIKDPNGSAAPSQPSGAHQKDVNGPQVPNGSNGSNTPSQGSSGAHQKDGNGSQTSNGSDDSNTPSQGSSGAQIKPGKPQASNPTPPPEIPGGLTTEEIVAKIVEGSKIYEKEVAQRANRFFKKNQLSSRAPAPNQDEQSPTPDDVLLVELKSGAQIEPEPIRVQEESVPGQSGAQDSPAPTPNEPEPEQHSLEASPSQIEHKEEMDVESREPERPKTSDGATLIMSYEEYVAFISGDKNQGAPSDADAPMDLGDASGIQMNEQAPNEQEDAPAPAWFPDVLVEHRSVASVPEAQNEPDEKMECEPGPSEEEDELQKVALHADIETGAHVEHQDDEIEVIELKHDASPLQLPELINLHQQTLRAPAKKFKKSRFLVRSGKRIPKMMAPKIARVRGAAPVVRLTKKKMSKSSKNAPEAQEEELKQFEQAVEYCEKNPLYDDPLFVSSVSLFDPYTEDTKVPQAKKIGENWFCLAQAYNKNMVEQGKANAQRDLSRPSTRARFEQLRQKIAVEHELQLKMGLIFYENPEEMEWMKRFQAGTLMTGRM